MKPVVFFDGACNLCNATVRFLIDRDPVGRLQFAHLQSKAAADLLRSHPVEPSALDAVVLLDGGRCYQESGAALRIARHLRAPWPALALFLVVPRPLRDAVYRWVARNRDRWYGRQDGCSIPGDDDRTRFIEGGSPDR